MRTWCTGVTEVVDLRLPRRAVEVAVEGQEDLVVAPDELVPQPLAVLGLAGDAWSSVDVDERVRGEDHRHVGVRVDDARRAQARVASEACQERASDMNCCPSASKTWNWLRPVAIATLDRSTGSRGARGAEPGLEVRLGGQVVLVVVEVVVAVRARRGCRGGSSTARRRLVEVLHRARRPPPTRAVRPTRSTTSPRCATNGMLQLVGVLGEPRRLLAERVGAVAGQELVGASSASRTACRAARRG